jgi:glucose/arabinose dehydrogenase
MGARNLSDSTKADGLVDFDGKGKYSAPEFVWKNRVAPTALVFLDSDKLGKQYKKNLFVASFNLGEIYNFDLNENRTVLMSSNTSNNSISKKLDVDNVRFAQGLGKITDMDIGPDGDLYVLSKYLDTPTIFRISSANLSKSPL